MNSQSRTPLEIYKLLPKTNCGKCLLPSCLAFAAAVVAGGKKLSDCPDLAPQHRTALSAQAPKTDQREREQVELIATLQGTMAAIDFEKVAPLIGATVKGDRLVINSLGKDFMVDRQGNLTSECHIIPWIQAPILSYISNPMHGDITGRWIAFRDLEGGLDWQGLFNSRCETPLRRLADDNPHLLADLIDLFMGRTIDWYEADIALILHPLPKVPILICYQAPEDDLESTLTIFFDACCGVNLPIRSLFGLCAGLVHMFTKIAAHHS